MSSSSSDEKEEPFNASGLDDTSVAVRSGSSSPQLQDLALTSDHETPPTIKQSRENKPGTISRSLYLRRNRRVSLQPYHELLLGIEREDITGSESNSAPLSSSQYGIVPWTAREKNIFFDTLSRKGKDAIPQIAAFIGTKSRLEVQDYLDILHRNLKLVHVTERNVNSVILSDIPAATEVGEECDSALDELAQLLSTKEEQEHNTAGKRKYKDAWLIDRDVAEDVEQKLESQDSADHVPDSRDEILATSRLLNVPNWIRLSETVFMNSGSRRFEDNWTNVCFADESPSVTTEAFSDFYTLSVSMTRRLVQSSIFLASSRIRAADAAGWRPAPSIRKEDVKAAANILKMNKPNFREFWVGAARRCALDVRERSTKSAFKTAYLSYDQVEERLSSTKDLPDFWDTEEARDPSPALSEDSDIYSEVFSEADLHRDGESSANSSDEELSDTEERHAAAVDRDASRLDNIHLQRVLNQPDPSAPAQSDPDIEMVNDIKSTALPKKPLGKRKIPEELMNWRDSTLYCSEWEVFGDNKSLSQALSEQRIEKRRKID